MVLVVLSLGVPPPEWAIGSHAEWKLLTPMVNSLYIKKNRSYRPKTSVPLPSPTSARPPHPPTSAAPPPPSTSEGPYETANENGIRVDDVPALFDMADVREDDDFAVNCEW